MDEGIKIHMLFLKGIYWGIVSIYKKEKKRGETKPNLLLA